MADLTDAQRLYAWGRSQFESQVAPVVWAGVLAMPLVVERGPGEGAGGRPAPPAHARTAQDSSLRAAISQLSCSASARMIPLGPRR